MIASVFRNIFRINLGVRKHERVLVFTDRVSPAEEIDHVEFERRSRLRCLALLASEIGRGYAKEAILCEYEATGSHGAEPPENAWKAAFGARAVAALRRKDVLTPLTQKKAGDAELAWAERIVSARRKDAVDVVVALAHYSTSHTRFRDLLTRVCRSRYASMPLFDMSMLEGPMHVDWRELSRMTKAIAREMNRAESVEVRTPNGTRISFSTGARRAYADTGLLTRPGSFGNLPAGEVFLAPLEGTARGRLVLEWAPDRELKFPVTLDVQNGSVVNISGAEEYAGQLRRKLSERSENSAIAEFGIGTNRRATRPDNILETEKILGTVHFALGDNSSFGGEVATPYHQDFIFFRPTVTLIHKDKTRTVLIKKGRLQ